VADSLQSAHVILGIKETPLNELITDTVEGRLRTHFMFSHTAKGQAYNMPLLARFTNATARLVDYELLTDRDGKRTVAFGWYAGAAGVPEALSALAHDHLTLGVSSPFLVSISFQIGLVRENWPTIFHSASATAL
jgi:alpha-aminoadipic semialdehyde synthase